MGKGVTDCGGCEESRKKRYRPRSTRENVEMWHYSPWFSSDFRSARPVISQWKKFRAK